MPLLLHHCGLTPRTAVIVMACLFMFFTGYRIIKDAIFVAVLEDIDNESRKPDDFPASALKTILKLLITDLALSAMLILSSLVLLLGVIKALRWTLLWWTFIACLFILFDLGVTIYLAVTYNQLSDIAWSLAVNCIWYAIGLYGICVVVFYSQLLRQEGNEYQNFNV